MKRTQLSASLAVLILSAAALITPSTTIADDVTLHRLLTGPDRCDHVISLLMRYGVNNDRQTQSEIRMHHPLGPFQMPVSELGDLHLVSVAQHGTPQPGCGPAFEVMVKNCSTRDVHSLRLTAVGLFGRINPCSPNRTETIACLGAGQTAQVTVTLPVEALAMGQYNGAALPLNRLLVVLDSYDQFLESNEANNLRLFELTEIPAVTVAEVASTSIGVNTSAGAASQASPTIQPAPAASSQAAPAQTTPAQEGPNQMGSPEATTLPAPSSGQVPAIRQSDLQSAINQFGQQTTSDQTVE
ncbi:hypothetical protein [Roseiconus lacunae]|uniref:hypothetical protein n=1 Tax=Roseiconus lacunae TaxID=2605694 RepID=UPI0011F0A173|nr:hypothetical protein [Roseiconus lacunae]